MKALPRQARKWPQRQENQCFNSKKALLGATGAHSIDRGEKLRPVYGLWQVGDHAGRHAVQACRGVYIRSNNNRGNFEAFASQDF